MMQVGTSTHGATPRPSATSAPSVCMARMGSDVHSDDLLTIYCGRPRPVTLCGYHAQEVWITQALASIPKEES